MNKQKENFIQQLAVNGVMVALYLVLELISVKIGNNIKITFSGLPIIISAVYFGPFSAAIVGGLGSFISQMLAYGFSPLTLLWVLPAVVRGLAVGCLSKLYGRKYLSVYVVVSSVLVSAINTFVVYIDSNINGYYNPVTFLSATAFRFVSGLVTAAVYVAILFAITKALDKVVKNSKM